MDFSFLAQWLLSLTAAANLVLGAIVYKKGPRNPLNRLFIGLTSVACLWALSVLTITIKDDYRGLLLSIRIAHAVASFIPWFIYALVYAFIYEKAFTFKKILTGLFLSLIIALASLTPAFIADVAFPLANKEVIYGPLFFLYILYFGAAMLYIIYKLFMQLRLSRGIARYQLRYFIGGILISFILGNLSNLFLPFLSVYSIDLRPFGPVFSLIMVISITYAIIKYRLMDIRLAIGKFMAYFLAVALLALVYISLMLTVEGFRNYAEANPFPFNFLLLLIVVIIFQPLKDKFQSLVNRFFYRGAYDYYNTLIDASRAMVSILKMDELLRFLVEKVVDTIYIERGVIFLKNKGGSFTPAAEKNLTPFSSPGEMEPLKADSHLLAFLQEKPEVLLFSDLKDILKEKQREMLAAEMRRLQAEAVVPIVMEGKLEAILSLGFKISGEPYSREDVSLLTTLSFQIAVALKNARLYQEVLDIKEYLENILKNMGNGLIAIDEEGRITTFNSAAERMTGVAASEAIGSPAEEVLESRLSLPLKQTLKTGQLFSDEEIELRVGGRTLCLCCNTARLERQETKERGAIMVLSDVTRLKELEREKSQAMRLASLGEMAAALAHEIKNPLVSIKTFAELLPGKYEDREFRESFSLIVRQEIERINKLIMELLNFSRIPKPFFEEVEVKLLLEEIFTLLAPQLALQKIHLKKLYRGELPVISADRDQLKQALLNICLNGIQAMPEGGELEVEVFAVDEAGFKDAEDAKNVKIVIKDTGPGIPPHQRERIFDPFFTTKPDGVGIGLSISHRIITDHRGTIKFKSRRKGTAFEITLPVAGAAIWPDALNF